MKSFDHPHNKSLLSYFMQRWDGLKPNNLSAPPSVYNLHTNPLGTHPDLADYFWNQLPIKLPVKCAWVAYGNPVLIHPQTGVIFGFAGGTHTYALRLPEEMRHDALLLGAKESHTYSDGTQLSLKEIGDEWILGGWLKQEPDWCLSAYNHAAKAI